ncbi:MAG: amino acid adenylation domain-containing protein, partial [Pirellulaceae bacterium]|nr:amino acid adenylation domain-containing protein [Pirellulaceae bacterium]
MTDTNPLANLSSDQQRALLQNMLRKKADAARHFPMSVGQQGLWHAFCRDRFSTAFNVFLPSRIRSHLDVNALQHAMERVVDRHPCLRTTFSDENLQLRQRVHDRLPPEFLVIDASQLSDEEIRQQVVIQTQRPFDLRIGPLLRMAVFRKSDDDYVVVATTHHIVVDFWSLILILNELRAMYPALAAGQTIDLPPADASYADFVQAQQAVLDNFGGRQLWQYWRETLRDAPPVLEWAADYQRPPEFTNRGDVTPLSFDRETANKINRLATLANTTPNAVVLAALQVFIRRTTNQRDFLIGSPFSGRSHQQFERTVGFFVNMLPLRANLSDNPSFQTLVQRAGKTLMMALEHESFPFAEIVRRIDPPRDPSRTPLFQVSCTFEKSHLREEAGRAGFLLAGETQVIEFGGLIQESFHIPHTTCHYDVEFIFEQTDTQLRGMICYCRDLFSSESAQTMAENFQRLFANLLDDPTALIEEVDWTLPQSRPFAMDGNCETLLQRVNHRSHTVALIDQDVRQTHRQIQEHADNIAGSLGQRGIGPGDVVPVVGRRGAMVTTAMLGVMKSGAAVIPIDSNQPSITWDDLTDDAEIKLVVVDQPSTWSQSCTSPVVTIDELVKSTNTTDQYECTPDDLAYVIYTSGSTGRPKGVMIQHRAIANTIRWRCETVTLQSDDRVLVLLSHQFDAGFHLAISTLAQGAACVWADTDAARDIDKLIDQIIRDRITVLPAVPSLMRLIVTHPRFDQCVTLRQVWMGGESMPTDLPELIWQDTPARIWNFYGPTEAAVESTAHEIKSPDPRRPISIGKPILNTEVRILDDSLRPVPDTVVGQLAIGGRGLAQGYFNRPDLTDQSFTTLTGPRGEEHRFYLTGDLCRQRVDGQIDFLGRIDDQIKLHGYRIELQEIDAIVCLHPEVAGAAVKVIDGDSPNAKLAAFVSRQHPESSADEFLDSIKRHVAEKLPAYKRPTAWELLPRLPIGPNGKINRRQLPVTVTRADDLDDYVAPSNALERHLCSIWGEMLEIDKVGVNQNFFQLGGSSLQAAMMTARLSEDLQVQVPTALLFDLADIAKLSRRLLQLYEPEMSSRFGVESATAQVPRSGHPTSQPSADPTLPSHPLLAPLKTTGDQTPIFMVHPPGGIVLCYRELADQLPDEQPLI